MEGKGRLLHIQADQLREKGEFVKALELLAQAIFAYQQEKLLSKIAECAASESLSYRHLFDQTGALEYLILAKHAAMAGIDIANKLQDTKTQAICEYNLGKVLESLGEIDDAINHYKKAIDLGFSDQPAMLAEMKTRLAVAEFKNGDKDAMVRFEAALDELRNSEEKDNYSKNVWLSGAYMHMAEALLLTDNAKARALLSTAEKIIDSDLRLKLRGKQLEKLKEKLV